MSTEFFLVDLNCWCKY